MSSHPASTSISDLPEELLSLILRKLTLRDILRLECVCKLWQRLIYDYVLAIAFYERQPMDGRWNWCGNDEHRIWSKDDSVSIAILPLMVNKCKYLQSIDFTFCTINAK